MIMNASFDLAIYEEGGRVARRTQSHKLLTKW